MPKGSGAIAGARVVGLNGAIVKNRLRLVDVNPRIQDQFHVERTEESALNFPDISQAQ